MPGKLEVGVLEGSLVRLEPLGRQHLDDLERAAQAPEIWTWMPADLRSREALDRWLDAARRAEGEGRERCFAVVLGGKAVGSTRYLDVRQEVCALEIGWTWYAPEHWGGRVNPECKRLLLGHAFEVWGANRVQLKTDIGNLRSQAAIARLGAITEGVLRNHRRRADGALADSVMFSILPDEWPLVKGLLDARLAAH